MSNVFILRGGFTWQREPQIVELITFDTKKVLITQEKIVPNIILVHKNSKNNSKYSHVAEVRSSEEKTYGFTKTISVKITNKPLLSNNKLFISIPRMKQDIPVFILFKALGALTDKEIIFNKREIEYIIEKYTYEAGARKLSEKLFDILRDLNLKRNMSIDVDFPFV